MCGIICFVGLSNGINHVLDALQLLEYRAPDSAGLAVLGPDGELVVRRCVGAGRQLRARIEVDPLPLMPEQAQIVVGHGRWAMVGAVTEENAHPIFDRSHTRVVVENGSHNASLMLQARAEQAGWWLTRGVADPVHYTQNTTEVLVYEWERMAYLLDESTPPPGSHDFLARLDQHGILDAEERALRLAIWRLRQGNAHACAFYGRAQPDTLYITSHNKPIALAIRTQAGNPTTQPSNHPTDHPTTRPPDQSTNRQTDQSTTQPPDQSTNRQTDQSTTRPPDQLMIASDVNAALMLWPKAEVDAAAAQIEQLQAAGAPPADIQAILRRFTVDVIFLDSNVEQGQELFARIDNQADGPRIHLSRYDGTPVTVTPQRLQLNPVMVGKRGHPTYTESHIAEIPAVIDDVVATYVRDGRVAMAGVWQDGELLGAGLNLEHLQRHFGDRLERLRRLLLIGEGSSWRDAQAAAPLLRHLLPNVLVNVYRPVAMLNLGRPADPAHDLAVEISWSGTTDSLLKVDAWLAAAGVTRLAVTGRPQSDLGRRAATSGGLLDVRSGIEVSVATVKGYQAILMTLNLLAIQLAQLSQQSAVSSQQSPVTGRRSPVTRHPSPVAGQLLDELTLLVPQYVRQVIDDQARRQQLRQIAERCRLFNKVVVIGNSPVDLEAELKIEELAQVVAMNLDFHAASLRPLVERSAMAGDDRARILFIVNATTPEAQQAARPILAYLRALNVFHILHTTHQFVASASAPSSAHASRITHHASRTTHHASRITHHEVFLSPQLSPHLQPLLDAPFFFDLAVALAYARGLSSEAIDQPRNLAKSVTTTGAEPRADVEARQEFHNVSLAGFAARALAPPAVSPLALALHAATAVLSEPPPAELELTPRNHLVVVTGAEATENGSNMAATLWQTLTGAGVVVYRRFLSRLPPVPPDTSMLQLVRAGAVLAIPRARTIALPDNLAPLQLELLAAVYLSGLAIRLARQQGRDTTVWEKSLVQLPGILVSTLADQSLAQAVQQALSPYVGAGYDKVQVIGGGQDFVAATSITRSLRLQGILAEPLYTDSAWHGPLAAVGGPGADHDALIIILATDPLFQAAALVDTQVYRTRHAPVILVVPQGNETLHAVRNVDASAVLTVATVPRPFTPLVNAALGDIIARQITRPISNL